MKTPLNLLLLEDNPHDAELLCRTLESGGFACGVLQVETEDAFRKALDSHFDVIISDFTLPSFNGKRALALARERRPEVPFIFVSGTIGEDAAIESLVGGATDYVLKHKFGRLVPAVRRALSEAEERKARQEAEQQLEMTLAQLRSLFDNLDEVFFSVDSNSGRLLQISPACERLYGLPQRAFFEDPQFWKNVATNEDHPAVQAAQSSLDAGQNVSCEYRISRPDGTQRWVQLKMKPVRGDAGHTIRVDGIISDITERKDLEAQFLRAQRMESLGSLAGGIAHDLNNVLAPILMGVELLRDQHSDAKTHSTLTTLELCTRRGANLVKQILMFARGVQGRRGTIDVGRLISEFEKILRQTFPKSIQIEVDVPSDVWNISGEKTQLEQVLMNLCVNARDAMPDGGVLTIRASNSWAYATKSGISSEVHAGPHVVIDVIDTGQGITRDNLDRIFDPFFTTKEPGIGTGLGLSTAIAIVKSHGGSLRVDSDPGRGTAFEVHLPALTSSVERDEQTRAADFPTGNGEVILVVDDEAAIRDMACTVLENYGYSVLAASDGLEAVSVYSANRGRVSVVVTDLDMPRLSGGDMIRVLQQIDPRVRVISVSGLIEAETYGQAAAGPIRAVLEKPFSPGQLLKTVHSALHSG